MKLLLLFLFCVGSSVVFSQGNQNQPSKVEGIKNDDLSSQFQSYFRKQEFSIQLPSNQNKVTALAQDNMPCVVPDTKAIAAIPNAWSNVTIPYQPKFHSIPNPVLPKVQSFHYNALSIPSK